MARSVTLQEIVDRARIHADQRQSGFINDDGESLAMLNEIWPELYDELCSIDPTYYSTGTQSISVSSSTQAYALADDFYKLTSVEFQIGTNTYVTLSPFNEAERNTGFATGSLPTGTVRVRYIPAPTEFTALSQSLDGIAGWDRLLSLLLAIDMVDAEEGNSDRLYRKYERTIRRIRETSTRDMGAPGTVTDVYAKSANYQYSTMKYRLYGTNVEFISTELLGAAAFGAPF